MRWLAYMLSTVLLRALLGLPARVRTWRRGAARVRGPFILAANHASHFDPPFIAWAVRRKIDWMTAAEFFEMPLAGAWLRAVDCFPVDRERADRGAVREALARLGRGRVLGMFPEGGIRDGANSVLGGAGMRPGIGALAQISGAPVLPCVIVGTDRLYDPRQWLRPWRRAGVWIGFGEPLRCEAAGKAARVEFEARLGDAMRAVLAEMKTNCGVRDDDLPQPPARRKGRL